jgi:hypothetical protein
MGSENATVAGAQRISLRVMGYRETDRSFRDRLSDHCPVSVTLDVR